MNQSRCRPDRPRPAPCAPVLTRALLATGGATALAAHGEPATPLLSEAERRTSLDQFMRVQPPGDVWVFAYGSLIWNPALRVSERRQAHVRGYHRSFCLSTAVGRGTPQEPGLVLGLEPGGVCHGVAYRIAGRDVASELPILWNREMLIGGYDPAWLDLFDVDGEKFARAIAFTIDRGHRNYAGDLPEEERVRRIAAAAGSWGSSADYLFRTIGSLREHRIHDAEIERLGDRVGTASFEPRSAAA